ncbi:MAG: thermonuclease family protein [Firmicutes bacterium]|nr:thermonuclease family protein [Bacillota bacterium]
MSLRKAGLFVLIGLLAVAVSACSASSTTANSPTATNQPTQSQVVQKAIPQQVATVPVYQQTIPQQTTSSSSTSASQLVSAVVTQVVDGDTMHVRIGNREDTIRLLCVDTPETKDPNTPVEPYGPEASAFAKQQLEGKQVKLEYDGPQRDKYGRLLVHLWVGDKLFNQMLLEKGLARIAYLYDPPYNHYSAYVAAQNKAKAAKLGIWSIPGYVTAEGYNLGAVQSASKKSTSSTSKTSSSKASSTSSSSKSTSSSKTSSSSSSKSSSASASTSHPEWAKALADLQQTGDVDCPDFSTHAAAQSFFEAHDPSADPYGLDRDKDGIACETLP